MDHRTFPQRASDWVTDFSGSWPFIIAVSGIGAGWIALNVYGVVKSDPWPFIFLNLALTIISTLQTPLIMMSNCRQNDVDRESVLQILEKIEALEKIIKQASD